MAAETDKDATASRKGEGNKTAARQDNEAQRRVARPDKVSGKVEEKAREAEKALDRELGRAGAIGKRHKAADAPR